METIYTIPINEAFAEPGGCPFCRLRSKMEDDALEYTLGAAMMEPSVRVEMNRAGFCRLHFSTLATKKNKLALALVLETRLTELQAKGESALTGECFVCNRVDAFESHCISNAVHMFAKDPAFTAKIAEQEFYCLTHLRQLLIAAKKELKRKQFEQLRDSLLSVIGARVTQLKADARKFADSFDYRNSGKELGDEKEVFKKAAALL